MEKRRFYFTTLVLLLVISGIANGFKDQKHSLEGAPETSPDGQKSPVTFLLQTENDKRKHNAGTRELKKIVRRRHAMRNRRENNQPPGYQQQNEMQYQQNQMQNQQQYQQPQYNYQPPPFSYQFPFPNPFLPQQPQVNNFYYPNPPSSPFFQQPFGPFGVGPFIIIQVPYCPQDNKQPPTAIENPVGVGVRIDNIPNFDEKLYQDTPTGISLKPIPPARPPSIVAPPLIREDNLYVASPEAPSALLPALPGPPELPRPGNIGRPQANVQRPRTNGRRTTTTTTTENPNLDDDGENDCAVAIIRCCTPNLDMNCFQQTNCPFVFDDPCEDLREAANDIIKKRNMWN